MNRIREVAHAAACAWRAAIARYHAVRDVQRRRARMSADPF
jgi:hypothetical protein